MDQSEKKVRLILNSVQELIGHIQQNTNSQDVTKNMLEHISNNQSTQLKVIEDLRSESLQLASVIQATTEMHKKMLDKDELQREMLQDSLNAHGKQNQILMDMQISWLKQYQDQKDSISQSSLNTQLTVKQEREVWLDQIKIWADKFSVQQNQVNLMIAKLQDILISLNIKNSTSDEIQNSLQRYSHVL